MSVRALTVDGTGSIVLEERAALGPGPGEVVVRPAYCGICGTDLELLHGEIDAAFVRYPLVLGHEWSGVVEAVGEGVTGIRVGMRCVAEGIVPCGHCPACSSGATNVCTTYDEIGFTRAGAASDQVVVPARLVHALGDAVPLLDAALTEPSAVVLTGLEKAGLRPGMRVVVVGDGTIALLAVLLAVVSGPPRSSSPAAAPSRRNWRSRSAPIRSRRVHRLQASTSRSRRRGSPRRRSRQSARCDVAARLCCSASHRPAGHSRCPPTCS